MMGGNFGYGMMGGAGGWGVFGTLYGIVILVDLVLLGVWLWKQIGKRK